LFKKEQGIRGQERVSLPPCPTSNKINYRAGLTSSIPENFRDLKVIPIPTGVATAAGHEPRERD